MSTLADLMRQASEQMKLALADSRSGLVHHGSQGASAEEAVRKLLRERFPSSIGVATGQVIDSEGNRSKQVDVILYDANATPILYNSAESGHQLVPVEGVIAVIEVKTKLRAQDLESIRDNMLSVKGLSKTAYQPGDGPITITTRIYGQDEQDCPTLYFVFAFESENLNNLTAKFREVSFGRSISKQVDFVCTLDHGVIFWSGPNDQVDAVPHPERAVPMAGNTTENALLLFYLVISRWVFQIRFRPINLAKYIPDDFLFVGTTPDNSQ